jgi:N-acetylneuraminic acid mutarotase
MMVVLAVAVALAAAGGAQAAFSGIGAQGTGRYDNTTTLLNDGRLLVAGGRNDGPLASAQLYNPADNSWANAASLNIAREGAAAVLLKDGRVLVVGGQTSAPDDPSPAYTATAEVYDPDAKTWTRTADDMSTGRFQPTMTLLEDGRVLVAGGTGDVGPGHTAASLDSAELYDPATDNFTDAGTMAAPRAMATATLLSNGKVLVAGGYDGKNELTSADLYDPDPAHPGWSSTGPLAHARDSATATILPNQDVLVAGGDGGSVGGAPAAALKSAEIYDSATEKWHGAADMHDARQSAAAALLSNGTALVTGGKGARDGTALDSAERYDPVADTWTPEAAGLTTARQGHTLTALDDGRAVVLGGNGGDFLPGLASVERYSPVTTTVTVPSFGSHEVGTSSDVVHAVVTNTGTAPLVVSDASRSGHDDFAITAETCSAGAVDPGESCDVSLVFTPNAGGQRSGTLTLTDNTAAGTSTATLNGSGMGPAGADPGGSTPPASGSTGGSGQTVSAAPTPRQEIKGAKSKSATRATCSVRNARSHGRARSTVTCRMTWPTRSAVALNAKLMRGRTVVMSTRTTAKSGQAKVTMRVNRRLSSGRYTVVITRRDGTSVLRQDLRIR